MTTAKLSWSGWANSPVLRRAWALGLLVALMSACGGVPKTHYYTLRVPAPAPAPDSKTPFTLTVERFRAPEILRDDRILYYQSPTQLNFYGYHRWSSDPATMVAEVVARRLDEMGLFTQVRIYPSREPSDYALRGRLLNFEEVDYEGGGRGRVALELTLVRTSDHKVVWSDTRQAEHAVEGKGVEGVVDALNASSEQLLGEALAGLAAEVEREFKKGSAKTK